MLNNQITIKKPILVSAFGPPGLAIVRSWQKLGLKPAAVWLLADGDGIPDPGFIENQTSIRAGDFFSEIGLKCISRFSNEIGAGNAICIDEKATLFLLRNPDKLPQGLKVLSAGISPTTDLLCKQIQVKVARDVGMNVLPTYIINSDGVRRIQIPLTAYPLCLRPSEPGAVNPGFKAEIINTSEELAEFLLYRKVLKGAIIAQPFKSLPNLVIHGARGLKGEHIGIQAFLVERKFEGVTLTIRPIALDSELKRQCAQFVDEFNLVGNYHFEFLYDPETGNAFFLEINARFGGTTAKVFASGYDEPAYALMAHGIDVIPAGNGKLKKRTISSKTALLKYLYNTLTNNITPLDYPDESKTIRILKTLWGLCFYKDDIFNWRDLRGSWAMYSNNVKAKLRR